MKSTPVLPAAAPDSLDGDRVVIEILPGKPTLPQSMEAHAHTGYDQCREGQEVCEIVAPHNT